MDEALARITRGEPPPEALDAPTMGDLVHSRIDAALSDADLYGRLPEAAPQATSSGGGPMRRLYNTTRSPYGRKVAIILRLKGLPYAEEIVDLGNRPDHYFDLHPLGKVPVLVDEDGTVIYDSTVIVEYLEDRYPAPDLRGHAWAERFASRRLEHMADDLSDQAVAAFFAGGRGDVATETRALAHLGRLLRRLEGELEVLMSNPRLGICQAAVLSALGYTEFRLGDGWRDDHPQLARWADSWAEEQVIAETVPHM